MKQKGGYIKRQMQGTIDFFLNTSNIKNYIFKKIFLSEVTRIFFKKNVKNYFSILIF